MAGPSKCMHACFLSNVSEHMQRNVLIATRDIARLHKMNEEFLGEVKDKSDERSHEHRLEEIYTLAEAGWLRRQPNVKEAIRERGLQIHAFVYDRETNSAVPLVETDEKREI